MKIHSVNYVKTLPLSRIIDWVKKGGFSVLDQGFFSGANFLVNILLARWLEPAQYGAFAVAFSVFLLIAAFHEAVLTEPMLVYGAGKYIESSNKYLGMLIYGHFTLVIPVSLILLGASLISGYTYSKDVEEALLGLVFAGPMILLLWVVRQAFYIHLRSSLAALSGGLYLALLIVAVYVLQAVNRLSQVTAFLSMGLSALLISLLFVNSLRPQWHIVGNPTPVMVVRDHWRYGRWALPAAGLAWISGSIYYVILPTRIGLEGVAGLKALMNLAMPAIQAINALSLLLLPLLSRYFRESVSKMATTMKLFLGVFLAGSGLYLLVLTVFRKEVLSLLYGEKYLAFSSLVPIVALLPLGTSLTAVLGSTLRAMERPDWLFWCSIASTVIAIVVGVLLALTFGVAGALWGLLLSSLTKGALEIFLFYNYFSEQWKVKWRLNP